MAHVGGKTLGWIERLFDFGTGWEGAAPLLSNQPTVRLERLQRLAHRGSREVQALTEITFAGQWRVGIPFSTLQGITDRVPELLVKGDERFFVELMQCRRKFHKCLSSWAWWFVPLCSRLAR